MAFKILSQEEIAVLNEHEKSAYEKAYQEYLERTAFVERLEQLDQVRMPKVSVKRKGIKKIKPPAIAAVKAQEFTVNTSMGVNLLNAAKMVERTTDNNSKWSAQINYRASLPSVLISAPEAVKNCVITPYVITKPTSVPIVEPSATKCEIQRFSVAIPEIQNVRMPEFIETVINEYSVSGIPSVKTELPSVPQVNPLLDFTASLPYVKVAVPNVESVKIAHTDTIELKAIPVTKPVTIDVSIEDYKMPQFVMNIVETPIVDYIEQEAKTVNLSVVPIPNCPSTPVAIEDTVVEIPTVDSISVPDVTAKVDAAKITMPKEVCIPPLAPEIHIGYSTVSAINTPAFSLPKEIHYSEPSCSVKVTPLPVILVPHIDTDAVLKTILSKIR